jgi:hypothetical protein
MMIVEKVPPKDTGEELAERRRRKLEETARRDLVVR